MTVPLLAAITALLCEILGLFSILSSTDVERNLLASFVGVGILFRLLGLRWSNGILRILVVFLVLGSIAITLQSHVSAVQSISRGIVLVHVLLWSAKDFAYFRYWRLGIGFVELVLASILTPETHMFFFIFFFTVSAALSLSFGFLENRLQQHQPQELTRPFSTKMLAGVIASSLGIFLSSLLIFPILPRSNWGEGNNQWMEAGYTEKVSFLKNTLQWARGNPRPMLWLIKSSEDKWNQLIPMGLLRGRALDHFNGVDWTAGSNEIDNYYYEPTGPKIQIQRESLDSEALPVPYGTTNLYLQNREHSRLVSGEYLSHRWVQKRVSYEVAVGGTKEYQSKPKKVHFQPGFNAKDHPEFWSLVQRLSANAKNENQKIQAVVRYLQPFSYSLDPVEGTESNRKHPIESFLLDKKSGHCELFATSAATLLRAMGVPTRLVVGFRAQIRDGDILKVSNVDAHAWVEVYTSGTGWFPLDLTPSLPPAETSWFENLSEYYDWVNIYWNQYILGYEFDWRELVRSFRTEGIFVFALLFIVFLWRRLPKKLPPQPRGQVTKVRKRWERKSKFGAFQATPNGRNLLNQYEEIRFSKLDPDLERLSRLDHQFQREYGQFVSARESLSEKR